VVGGSIASLTAADAALRRGRPVELLLPRGGVGAGFLPLRVAGRRLDLGIRLLELDREDAATAPALDAYEPGPAGHAPYLPLVAEWVTGLVGDRLREVDRPAMALDGRLVDDIYFTVDLDGLAAALPADEARRTASEAAAARRREGDAGVLDGRHDLLHASLEDASRTNHGDTFHRRFIAPMCAKIHPRGAAAVPAALRRKLWMPLFYPRTLERAAAGSPTGFAPRRPFHTVEPGGMGAVVEALLARIRSSAGARVTTVGRLVRVARVGGGATGLAFDTGVVRSVRRPVIGVSAEEAFAAAGGRYAPARVPMAIAWVEVDEADVTALPSLAHIPDPDVPAFRVSPGGEPAEGARLFTVELRHDIDPADVEAASATALRAAGLVREGAPVRVVHRFAGRGPTDPTLESLEGFARARAALDEAGLEAEVVGGASAFGADAFNEQVVQGLRAEEMTA
jgi:hypothetical protein